MSSLNGSGQDGKTYAVVYAGKSLKTALRWLHRGTSQNDVKPALRNIAGQTDEDGRAMLVSTDGFRLHAVRDTNTDTLRFAQDKVINVGDKMPTTRPEAVAVEIKGDAKFPDFSGTFPHRRPQSGKPVAQITVDPALLRDILADFETMVTLTLYEENRVIKEAGEKGIPVVSMTPLEITGKLHCEVAYQAYALLMPMSESGGFPSKERKPTKNWRPLPSRAGLESEEEQRVEAVVNADEPEPDEYDFEPDAADMDPDEGDYLPVEAEAVPF